MIRYIILTLFILFILDADAQTDSVKYSFFVAGHTYGKPGVNNIGLHPPLKQKFGYIKERPEIKFGILTGDIVYPNPVAQDWDEVDADIDSLGLPVYFAVGNHDMENRELFESRYGSTYYSFTFENDLFIFLDPNIDAWNISGEQLLFLKNTVEEYKEDVDNIFVFFHQMLWRENNNKYSVIYPNSFAGRAGSINFWSEIAPLFLSLENNVFMFAGDFGAADWSDDFMYDSYSNISLIGSGMGEGPGDNFVVTNIHSDKTVTYDLICLNDSLLHCFGELTDYRLTPQKITSVGNATENIKVYPNPTHRDFTVDFTSPFGKFVTFFLFNPQGGKVFEKKVAANSKVSFAPVIKSGVYIFRAEIDGKIIKSGKLVIL
ncbi:T9SS type A sorting domain-containing protein [Maribellus comscasis]|uniref:T9SS type A sorting domain-containing protein n=1 Tax=Maribellus comscasis TaxID=2681766 RepID=A0A6I6JQB5_9BACT|nr:metallophosphoesterase [Maribellus comscasis]QGY43248.1 T9SS type A sorting domain-containing protein [Maribellus comscasis]